MFKKWFSIALTLMLLCSSFSFALAEAPVVDFASLEGVIKYEEPIEISFARPMDSTVMIDESDPRIKSYTENLWMDTFKEALNINVTYDWISTDGDSNDAKWGAAIASGNLPDAGIVSNAVYQQLLEAGMVADMTDIYEKEANALYKSLNTPEILGNMTTGGRLYGLPATGNKYIGNAVLFVRTDWLEKLNLEAPKTIDEVVAIARAFKEAKLGGEDTIGLMFADAKANDGLLKGFMNGYDAFRGIWVEDAEGKLAYSDTLPEMREALLALQALYAEGLINADFAVTNATVAQEYVASGKCGIFYSTDWTVTTSMQACVDLDPSANFICVGIPGLTEDHETKIQTGAISVSKLFINKDCKYPEAIVRMINLHCTLSLSGNMDWYYAYESTQDGKMLYKLLPWNGIHFQSAINDISYANSIRLSRAAGELTVTIPSTTPTVNKMWIVDGNDPWWYNIIGGEGGAYTYDYDMYMSGRMIPDAFNGLPTETMAMLGDVVNDALNTAMLEVIMGADISTYDEAVKTWFATGGQMITDEVNEWYAAR